MTGWTVAVFIATVGVYAAVAAGRPPIAALLATGIVGLCITRAAIERRRSRA